MHTNNMFMNHSSNIRLSETQQENRDKYEWWEHPTNESKWTLGNEKELKTKSEKSKLTYKKDKLTKDVKQTVLGGDYNKDLSTFGGRKKDRNGDRFAFVSNEILRDCSQPDPGTNDYGTKLTNPCKSTGLRSQNGRHVGSFATYTDYTYSSGPRDRNGDHFAFVSNETLRDCSKSDPGTNYYGTKLTNPCESSGRRSRNGRHMGSLTTYTDYTNTFRDGELTRGNGMQNEEDEMFSWTGKYQNGLTFGGGKIGKETDNNVKEMSQSSHLEPMDIKNEIGSAAIDIRQSVISTFLSESFCSIIDSSREKGFQNTNFSEILTNACGSSMQTFKHEFLTQTTRIGFKCLSTAVTQLHCVEGPLKHMSIICEIMCKIKDFLDGGLTLWQLINWLLFKAVSLGIGLVIACIFGPVGLACATAISVALNVIKHLVNQWFQ